MLLKIILNFFLISIIIIIIRIIIKINYRKMKHVIRTSVLMLIIILILKKFQNIL